MSFLICLFLLLVQTKAPSAITKATPRTAPTAAPTTVAVSDFGAGCSVDVGNVEEVAGVDDVLVGDVLAVPPLPPLA